MDGVEALIYFCFPPAFNALYPYKTTLGRFKAIGY